jgi:tetratricopeptide (TPR) repeat protein
MRIQLSFPYSLLFSALFLLSACDLDQERRELINSRLEKIDQVKDPAKITELAQAQLEAAEKINYRKGIADAEFFLGRANYRSGNYQLALQHHLQALEIRRYMEDKAGTAKSYTALGNIYFHLTLYPEALQYYQKALEANQQLDKTEEIAEVYRNVGLVYRNMKQWEKAKRNFEDALVLYQQLHNQERIGWLYNDLGINQELEAQETGQADYARILSWYKESMRLNEALQARQGLGWVYINVGRMYCKLEQPAQALEYLQKAEPLLTQDKDYPNLVIGYTRQGEAYRQLGKPTQALEALKKAEQLEEKVMGSAKENIGETYKVLQQVYAQLKDQAKVRLYQEKEQGIMQAVAQIQAKGQLEHLQNQVLASKAREAYAIHALSYSQFEALRTVTRLNLMMGMALLLLFALLGGSVYFLRMQKHLALHKYFVHRMLDGEDLPKKPKK